MITDNIRKLCVLHFALHFCQVEESFIAFRAIRALIGRKHSVELHRNQRSILHLILGIAGMYIDSVDHRLRGSRVEVLVFQLTNSASVYRIGKICAELLQIKVIHSAADFFIRRKSNRDRRVLLLRMRQQPGRHCHNLRNSGLIIGSQQCGSVRDDQRLSLIRQHLRIGLRAHDNIPLRIQQNISAIIVLHNARLDIRSGSVRRSIHMCNKAQCLLSGSSRNLRIDIVIVLIEHSVRSTHGLQLLIEHPSQILLLLCAGKGIRILIGLCIYRYIP